MYAIDLGFSFSKILTCLKIDLKLINSIGRQKLQLNTRNSHCTPVSKKIKKEINLENADLCVAWTTEKPYRVSKLLYNSGHSQLLSLRLCVRSNLWAKDPVAMRTNHVFSDPRLRTFRDLGHLEYTRNFYRHEYSFQISLDLLDSCGLKIIDYFIWYPLQSIHNFVTFDMVILIYDGFQNFCVLNLSKAEFVDRCNSIYCHILGVA